MTGLTVTQEKIVPLMKGNDLQVMETVVRFFFSASKSVWPILFFREENNHIYMYDTVSADLNRSVFFFLFLVNLLCLEDVLCHGY